MREAASSANSRGILGDLHTGLPAGDGGGSLPQALHGQQEAALEEDGTEEQDRERRQGHVQQRHRPQAVAPGHILTPEQQDRIRSAGSADRLQHLHLSIHHPAFGPPGA
ncbi:MAG TPA: hypothetical protein PKY30_17645 [Myxococcota bacterium]|nr:hypothetical protein [Myxococcota bacterium]